MDQIKVIVGLGNPGTQYEKTRHNAGYRWVDAIAAAKRASWKKESKFAGWTTRVEEGEAEFLLLKPATYMNESGRSVSAVMRFFKIEPGQMLVVHDELDLAPGVVKLKRGGGTGGHNGLADIGDALDSKDFWRLRIGIGHPRDSELTQQDVVDYVLKPPRAEERAGIVAAIGRAMAAWPAIAAGDMEAAMMALHTTNKDPR